MDDKEREELRAEIEKWRQEYYKLHEFYDMLPDIPLRRPDNEWVEVEYASHAIRPWAVEEHCSYCGKNATHKIEETTGPIHFHPLTAYVCCEHFFGFCGNYPYEDMS